MTDIQNKRSVVVGLFVFLGILFLVAGILMVGNLRSTFKSKMTVVCLFDDVNGLQTGNNVWFSGVKVGTVGKLQFTHHSKVLVFVNIENSAQHYIRKDAKVKISNDGLMGNKIMVIVGGTQHAPVVADGDTLLVQKTFSTDGMLNTFQENNINLLAITSDLKVIFHKIADGKGTLGQLIMDSAVYENINAASVSLQLSSAKAQELMNAMASITAGLNNNGTLIKELIADTVLFKTLRSSMVQLQQMSDTANVLIRNLKQASSNVQTPFGVLMHDEVAGAHLRETIINLESSSQKLNEDLEAVRHHFLFRGYFKKKAKEAQNNGQ
ncbi:phospholipid/cholesterol/gamma-HCH transport system substrate-binding protein [Breznakibacter xylanolyticus]|uniref:Phospholipid/cholesterol/gamma-HCH transport system substrate-binding protein n=1 Tax=Breznakibacter xylanolyticus TaxID=990 RepID=A0A2W7MVQ8_9BACT|nr:MlaD family protein [Breznakibacter xylanolyticus]PZX11910.1 phospholipid/cholesterol/gamma-HCH transport system substrate-binding protein [Breznakibacter xylanolyticus]